ncbi:MAG: hypothetical protein MUO85_03795, partial [candidate division Zixibacteria bacterium]|nr:hypothetical protein [candidate division Zixibacteria bacterium]
MIPTEIIGTWLGAALTLFIFSFLYKDNPFYKFAEHLFVGVSAGYGVALEFHNVFLPNLWNPLWGGNLWFLVPFAFGILLFTRFISKIAWLSRWSIALIIGVFAGIYIVGYAQGDLVQQIHANLLPVWQGNLFSFIRNFLSAFYNWLTFRGSILIWLEYTKNFLLVVGVLVSLVYFFFSKEHKGALGVGAKVGV